MTLFRAPRRNDQSFTPYDRIASVGGRQLLAPLLGNIDTARNRRALTFARIVSGAF